MRGRAVPPSAACGAERRPGRWGGCAPRGSHPRRRGSRSAGSAGAIQGADVSPPFFSLFLWILERFFSFLSSIRVANYSLKLFSWSKGAQNPERLRELFKIEKRHPYLKKTKPTCMFQLSDVLKIKALWFTDFRQRNKLIKSPLHFSFLLRVGFFKNFKEKRS